MQFVVKISNARTKGLLNGRDQFVCSVSQITQLHL